MELETKKIFSFLCQLKKVVSIQPFLISFYAYLVLSILFLHVYRHQYYLFSNQKNIQMNSSTNGHQVVEIHHDSTKHGGDHHRCRRMQMPYLQEAVSCIRVELVMVIHGKIELNLPRTWATINIQEDTDSKQDFCSQVVRINLWIFSATYQIEFCPCDLCKQQEIRNFMSYSTYRVL